MRCATRRRHAYICRVCRCSHGFRNSRTALLLVPLRCFGFHGKHVFRKLLSFALAFARLVASHLTCLLVWSFFRLSVQVETLAEAGSYEDALSLCAMCKVRSGVRCSTRTFSSRIDSCCECVETKQRPKCRRLHCIAVYLSHRP